MIARDRHASNYTVRLSSTGIIHMNLSDSQVMRLMDAPQTYAEMCARPRFQQSLDRRTHGLRQVLSPYHFQTLAPCGLQGCRKAHRDGLLVETEDDLETNLGHVCGAKIFPDWGIKVAAHKRQRDRQDLLDRTDFLLSKAPSIRDRIRELEVSRFGVLWVHQVRDAVRRVLGDDLFDSLKWGHKRGDLAVFQERRRSEAEIDRLVDANKGRVRRSELLIERNPVGQLEPMPWIAFDADGDLRGKLLTPLDHFLLLDHRQLDLKALRKVVKQFDGWEDVLNATAAATEAAVRFFDQVNLQRLVLWVPESSARRREALSAWIGSPARQKLAEGRQTSTSI